MKNKILLIWTSISSLILLLIFGLLKISNSHLLDLESKWLIVAALPIFIFLVYSGLIRKFKALGIEFESNFILEASPSEKNLANDNGNKLELSGDTNLDIIPADYIYINHTSFLRQEKQEEFQLKTNIPGLRHYDIQVIIDSYYQGALERIKYVTYFLHQSYPEPVQTRSNKKDHFCLKEIANGEYVLTAKIYLKDSEKPIVLQRYITLWTSGPKII